ncbi:MAG TPA: tRNA pseudouridine(13) synthase TruD [Phycisphaerae bacterium]|nr:tRNA pseudouridine(13) synthase TruD [Phycisphaerae bacterium]
MPGSSLTGRNNTSMIIKQTPEDFLVEEILTPDALAAIRREPGPVAVYRLTKRGLSTPEAVERLAEALRVPPKSIVFSGLKDKYATTVQHVSLTSGRGPAARKGGGWQAERLGWTDRPLASSSIAANRFRIRLAGLTRRACEAMDLGAERLATGSPGVLRFVNYFGRQRFGTTRHGRGFLARHLIDGDFEQALKLAIAVAAKRDRRTDKIFKRTLEKHWGRWAEALPRLPPCPARAAVEVLARGGDFREAFAALPYFIQQINVEAYQSYLWNATASELLGGVCPPGALWEAKDPLGLMRFAAARAVPPALARLEVPLLGPRTQLLPPWADAAEAVLKRHDLKVADLRIPGLHRPFFGEAPRRWLAETAGFGMSVPSRQPSAGGRIAFSRTLSFELPRGAYATVLLAALE